ncbi:type IV secretion protein Rhs, partial [Actinomadura sp. WAC 06369]
RGRGGRAGGRAGGVFGKMAGNLFPAPKGGRRGGPNGGGPSGPNGRKPSGPATPGDGRGGDRRGGSQQSQARPTEETPKSGDPISIITGDVLLSQRDVSWQGVLPFVLERTHVSSYRAGRWFGPSWASTLDQALDVDAEGVHFLAADGSVRSYPQVLVPKVVSLPAAGPLHPLTLTAEGSYTLTVPRTGRTLHFPAPGEETGWSRLPLTAVTDRNGNRIDLVYEEQVLVEIRHSGGYRIVVDTAASAEGERRISALRTPDGTVLRRFGYDTAGHLTEVHDTSGVPQRFAYDDRGRLTGWVDRNEHWYRYTYDDEGRAVRGEGSEGVLNAAFTYDPGNRRTLVTDALGHTTTHRYNDLDQIVEVVDPLGAVTRFEWDAHDRLLARTDPLGHTTRHAYDERGNLARVEYPDGASLSAEYNELDLAVRIVQPDGAEWRKEYDERGNLVRRADPSGAVTRFEYGPQGAPVAITDALGHTYTAENNEAGLPLTVTDPRGATHRYSYDAMGFPTGSVDPAGRQDRFGWSPEGRLLSRTRHDGATERWRHDGEGNTVEYVDPSGRSTRTEYGPLDLPTKMIRSDGSSLSFTHDAERRLTQVTTTEGLTWSYRYDPCGRIIAETDFNHRTLTYSHDAAGRLAARTNGAGQSVTYDRDVLGKVVRKTAGSKVTTFGYDPVGRLVQAVSPDADLRFTYDQVGRVLAETCNTATLGLTRDARGQVVGRTTPSGAESRWTYGPAGLPTDLRTGGRTLAFKHDAAGREIERRIGAEAVVAQQWDDAGRLSAQTLWTAPARPGEEATLQQHRTYAHGADGRLTGMTDRLAGDRAFDSDERGRLTAVRAQGWTERYAYDDMGNIVHGEWPESDGESGDSGVREYTGTLIKRAGRVRYEHDAQGRVVLREHTTLSGRRRRWTFQWDAEDRLVEVRVPGGSRWRYHYDALGRRVAKQQLAEEGETVRQRFAYTWDGTRLAEQTHSVWDSENGRYRTRTTTWDYEPGTFRPLTQIEHEANPDRESQAQVDTQFYAIVADLVGAPAELVRADGQVVAARPANIWGARGAFPSLCPLRMPGQYQDPETGLNYNYNRYYDPVAGGYVTADPLGITPQPNPHSYVPDPTTWADPLGLTPHNYGGSDHDDEVHPDQALLDEARLERHNAPADASMTAMARIKGSTDPDEWEVGYSGATGRVPISPDIDLSRGGQTYAGDAGNCAEVRAGSMVLRNNPGAQLRDVEFIVVESATGNIKPSCLSCLGTMVTQGARDVGSDMLGR